MTLPCNCKVGSFRCLGDWFARFPCIIRISGGNDGDDNDNDGDDGVFVTVIDVDEDDGNDNDQFDYSYDCDDDSIKFKPILSVIFNVMIMCIYILNSLLSSNQNTHLYPLFRDMSWNNDICCKFCDILDLKKKY